MSAEHAVTARGPSSDAQAVPTRAIDEHIKIAAPSKGVVRVKVLDGSKVEAGEVIAVQESAKTELQVRAPKAGYVRLLVSDETVLAENGPIAELEAL